MAPLITVEDAAALLPIRAGNTSQDAKLNLLILSASALIEQAISRELEKKERVEFFRSANTYRQYYDFSGTENTGGTYVDPRPARYVLKAFNIDLTAPFVVRYDPTRVFGDDTIVDPAYYSLNAADGLLMMRFAMYEAQDALKITYTGGYAANSEGNLSATIPSEIKMACLAQVLHMFGKFTADNIGKTADTTEGRTGGNNYSTKMGLVPEALSLIARYKPVGVGLY
jgi:hypothetical protein